MANGDPFVVSAGHTAIKLLDAQPGNSASDGQWVSCGEYDVGTVIIQGAATTTQVEVDGSNDATIPANNTHGVALATATAAGASGIVNIAACPRWIKARLFATGTGTVNAIAVLRSYAS